MLGGCIGSLLSISDKTDNSKPGTADVPAVNFLRKCHGLASLLGPESITVAAIATSRNTDQASVMQEPECECESSSTQTVREVSRFLSRRENSSASFARSRLKDQSPECRKRARVEAGQVGSRNNNNRCSGVVLGVGIVPALVVLLWFLTPYGVFGVVVGLLAVCSWWIWLSWLRDLDEKGVCTECKSVNQSKEEEEKQLAQRAHRAKQQFMAYVFHNIRVPFNAIVLGLGHMRASATGEETGSADMLDLVQLMLDCAETMTNVLDDVTDMGNLEEGRIELNKDVFDLLAVVKFLAWGLKDLLEQKQISLNIDIDPVASKILESHNIVGDKHRTVQTLGNFLSNAVKFTPTGGKLDLEIKCEELDATSMSSWVPEERNGEMEHKSIKLFIAVNDTGAGISVNDQDKLFEADSFISSSWIQKAGVSGLGLSVAKRFIEQLGGQIGVRSQEQGSTFFFSAPFPLVPAQKRANCSVPASGNFYTEKVKQRDICGTAEVLSQGDAVKHSAALTGPCRRKVLLVEDTRINRIILRKVLQNLNLHCDEAENGQIAVDLHRQGKSYDLVLMDKEMPVMDGHEATRTLRMMGVKTPIVALTGNALQSDKELFFEAGVNEFQTKPLSRDKLIQLLARYGVESSPKVAAAL